MPPEPSAPRIDAPSALPIGTRLGEFELRELLGIGGFGIVYLAFDHALEREVAVKEYMPSSLAGRTATLHVSLRSQSDAETFALGLKSFVNEARLLARFDDPSLLKVHRFWEANGTAYMAMPVMRGRTLKEVRQSMATAPDEAWVRAMLEPLLNAIERLHFEGVFHRDIAPDNIQIDDQGHPVLLDFGAARRVLSDKSQTLTAILKPAYAPIEQYAEVGAIKQGPWTDLYALGATLHYLLLKRPPAPATVRAVHDDPSALTTQRLPGCSESFLRTIDWMLAPRPRDRPQSVAALKEVLAGRLPPPLRPAEATSNDSQWDETLVLPGGPAGLAQRQALIDAMSQPSGRAGSRAGAVSAVSSASASAVPDTGQQASTAAGVDLTVDSPNRSRRSPVLALLAGGLGLVAVAAAAWWFSGGPAPAQIEAAAAPAVAQEARLAAPVSGVVAVRQPVQQPVQEPVQAPTLTSSQPATQSTGTRGVSPDPGAQTAAQADAPTTAAVAAPAALSRAPALAAPAAAPSNNVSANNAAPPRTATPAMPNPGANSAQSRATQVLPNASVAAGPRPLPAGAAPVVNTAPARPSEFTAPAAQPGVFQPAVPAATPPVAAAPAAALAKSPEATCSGSNPVMHFVCMERECLRAELSGNTHADCQKWRQAARRDK